MRALGRRIRGQAGEGRIGAIIALLVLVALIYLLIKLVPVYIRKAELAEEIERNTREYVVNEVDQDVLYQTIIKEADLRGIRIDETAIQLRDSQSMVEISVEYTEVVPMVWGEWSQRFVIEKEVPKL